MLEETNNQVQGIHLDRGTSFYETLDTISSDEASQPVSQKQWVDLKMDLRKSHQNVIKAIENQET